MFWIFAGGEQVVVILFRFNYGFPQVSCLGHAIAAISHQQKVLAKSQHIR